MKAKCSDCGMETRVKLKTRKLALDREETYIQCDVCFAVTTCYITDRKTRQLQKETKKLRNKRHKTVADIQRINAIANEVEARMNELLRTHERRR